LSLFSAFLCGTQDGTQLLAQTLYELLLGTVHLGVGEGALRGLKAQTEG
jgi:hypothetical protein